MAKVDYKKLMELKEVLRLIATLRQPMGKEPISLWDAYGRVLAEEIHSPEDLPHFARSTMDGYAVIARDTFGASATMPSILEVVGSVKMGEEPAIRLDSGRCAAISTGGMLPSGADAVVMLEQTQELDENTVEIFRPVAVGENVIQVGEDIKKGQLILKAGRKLSAADLGLLSALGITKVPVRPRLKVSLISTGDEIVDPEEIPTHGKIRDVNSVMVSALIKAFGQTPIYLGKAKDDFQELQRMLQKGLEESDLVLISGGSSIGTRDLTINVLNAFKDFELLCHGIMISPGKPTIIGQVGPKPVIGLPGHVASAFVIMVVIVRPLIRFLSGMSWEDSISYFSLKARASRNIESQPGREDYVRARLLRKGDGYFVEPLFGKSGLISTVVEGDGLIRIETYSEGVYEGEEVEFIPFGPLLGEV